MKSITNPPPRAGGPAALAFHAATLGTFFAASSAPTPLYRLYQQAFAFSPVLITIIFSAYAFSLLLALLIAGSISDHLGRRPVIFVSLIGQLAAMALFIAADGPNWLIAARIVQGLATGIAGASMGAALVDLDQARGPVINSIAPLSGMAIGALGTSALVQYAPAPTQLVYAIVFVVAIVQALIIWKTPETTKPRPGLLNSLRPEVAVPSQARRSLLSITPINIGGWALAGFYLSLVPSLVSTITGSKAPLTGGSVVAALTISGAATVYLLRKRSGAGALSFGAPMLIAGIALVIIAVHVASVPLLVAGTLVAGSGLGANFLGSLRSIMPLARPEERAGLLSAFYIQSYLAFSLPAIGAGFLVGAVGFTYTADIYAAIVALLIGAGLLALRAGLRTVEGAA
ncbi:MFS transporter [Rhizobium sp. BK251]|uniref:MFS transporter n=1 Tax=Rhizobium sp. BK251 TaxID=2512125 RepID=UPI0010465E06|nr:MFS transporter [Rhizobium sp. BK251]